MENIWIFFCHQPRANLRNCNALLKRILVWWLAGKFRHYRLTCKTTGQEYKEVGPMRQAHWVSKRRTLTFKSGRAILLWEEKCTRRKRVKQQRFIEGYCNKVKTFSSRETKWEVFKWQGKLMKRVPRRTWRGVGSMWWGPLVCSLMLIKVRSLTCHRDWEMEAIFLMFAFQRNGLEVLE